MNIVLVGAGNVATHLGKALLAAHHTIAQVYSRTEESARPLAEALGCGFTTNFCDITADAEAYILSVKDSVLADVAKQLTNSLLTKPHAEGRGADALFVHTAGSMPIEVLPSKRRAVLYPMQTFSKARSVDFSAVPVFIESDTDSEPTRLLAESISRHVHMLNSLQRKQLHVAAVFGCNFANHMYALCADVLAEANIPFEVMLPLIDETARKVHELAPRDAQTGPAIRRDTNVMQSHIDMLDPEKQIMYRLISESIMKRND